MLFVLYEPSYDWKWYFEFRARNFMDYDYKLLAFVFCKARCLTKMTMKTFNVTIYTRAGL